MPKLKQYLREELQTWRVSKLGGLYLSAFHLSVNDPSERPQLDTITEILNQRPLNERTGLFRAIKSTLKDAVANEDYERARVLKENLDHYHEHILD